MDHPYKSFPPRAFWSKAVARGFDPAAVPRSDRTLFWRTDRIMSAGSCFAANLVPYLETAGFHYLRTETPPQALAGVWVENLGYHKFSAAYGNIYTAAHLRQLVLRVLGEFRAVDDRWYDEGTVVDPFRPGLRFRATDDVEFDRLTAHHLERVGAAITEASVFVFTLGLTEAWRSRIDGAVYPSCPGTVAGVFDPDHHEFHNYSVTEVIDDLRAAIAAVRRIRRDMRFVLTVSPVPLVATATPEHVLQATVYSKSVLRVAADEIARSVPGVIYFPAYELVTGPQALPDTFEADRREVSRAAIDRVMAVMLSLSNTGKARSASRRLAAPIVPAREESLPTAPPPPLAQETPAAVSTPTDRFFDIAARLTAIECEEAAADTDPA